MSPLKRAKERLLLISRNPFFRALKRAHKSGVAIVPRLEGGGYGSFAAYGDDPYPLFFN